MKGILKELWRGELRPRENIGQDQDYRQLHVRLCEAEKAFRQRLSPEHCEIFDAYLVLEAEIAEMEDEISFARGVCLGVQLMLAALQEE